jgi:DNA-binding response OmpR family regulator
MAVAPLVSASASASGSEVHMHASVLVVDGEKNVRLSMVHALESTGLHVESALTGEEALLMLRASRFDLMFLELKMPGLDGIEVLRRAKASWPSMHVVVITAHGTVERAVEAMKLGAADFIEKPFTAERLRELARSVLAPLPAEAHAVGYEGCLAEARRAIAEHRLAPAVALLRRSVGLDPTRPEAFNLLGAVAHLSGQRYKAQDCFRAAIALDPTFKPAHENLERSASGGVRGLHMELALGDDGTGATRGDRD